MIYQTEASFNRPYSGELVYKIYKTKIKVRNGKLINRVKIKC